MRIIKSTLVAGIISLLVPFSSFAEKVKIGDLEVKYNKSSQSTGTVNNIFDVYPWLQSFLGAYCSGGSGSYQVRVMRG